MNAEGRIVVITGSRKGIGAHLANRFAERGDVVVGFNRQPAPLDLPDYEFECVDVGDEPAVAAAVGNVARRHGRIDILVNNAGVAAMNHSLLTPASSLERLFRVNVTGTFLVSREVVKVMRRRRWGRIVNLGSIAAPMAIEGEAAYAASKGAVVTLTRVLAREFAPWNITCNVVAPTPIATDLIAGVPQEKIQEIVDRLAVKRLGTFEDVANVVDFFVRPESDYVTGQVINLGGV